MAPKHTKLQSLFQQIFHCLQNIHIGNKTENLPKMTRFCLWSFYEGVLEDKHLSITKTFEQCQEWSSYTGLTVVGKLLDQD